MTRGRERIQGPGTSAVLAAGFVALAVGVLIAYAEPASGYELSIYMASPVGFWAGIAIATGCALLVGLTSERADHSGAAMLLLGGAVAAVAGLPLLRNYRYYGTADALTHLGWARGLAAGTASFYDIYYPGVHAAAAFIANATGYPTARALLYVLVLFSLLMVAGVALLAWTLTRDLRVTALGAASGALMLPINDVGTHMAPQPISQAILLSALFLYLLARFVLDDRPTGRGWSRPSRSGALLAIAATGLVLFHGQLALDVLLVLLAIAAVQAAMGRVDPLRWRTATRPVYAQTAFLAVVFVGWSVNHERFWSSVRNVTGRFAALVRGESVTNPVVQRGGSLAEIGAGLPELFAKLFLVSAVFAVLAGGFMALNLWDRLDPRRPDRNAFTLLLTAAVVPVVVVAVAYLVGSLDTQSFRHLGFVMLLVTVVGALALAGLSDAAAARFSGRAARVGLVLVVGTFLVFSTAVVFPDPYIYNNSKHVSDQQLDGYEATFAAMGDHPVLGVREGPHRYADAILGVGESSISVGTVTESQMVGDTPVAGGTGDAYVVVTRMDYEREVFAYRQLRYSAAAFDAVRDRRGWNRVLSDGEVRTYLVHS